MERLGNPRQLRRQSLIRVSRQSSLCQNGLVAHERQLDARTSDIHHQDCHCAFSPLSSEIKRALANERRLPLCSLSQSLCSSSAEISFAAASIQIAASLSLMVSVFA